MSSLILTNGDTAADLLTAAGKQGHIFPWRDSLHEGPLGPISTQEEQANFRSLRAVYWAGRKVEQQEALEQTYQTRDRLLENHKAYDAIELWFEHDLYDQLQLIEILTRLYHLKRFDKVFLVQAETYLGMQQPDSILKLEGLSQPVGEQMMAIADLAWQTVSHETPEKLAEFVTLKPAGFPFLRQALTRLLEELPGLDGLSRTQRQMLYSLNRRVNRPGMLFGRCQAMEEAQFWGDLGFFEVLSNLQFCKAPLIEGLPFASSMQVFQESETRKSFLQSQLTLTALGQEVLTGTADHSDHNEIDIHIGGTHIKPNNLWRWDKEQSTLQAPLALN